MRTLEMIFAIRFPCEVLSYCLYLAILPTSTQSQSLVVRGAVADSTQRPLAKVSVSVQYLSHRLASDPMAGSPICTEEGQAVTDDNGRFEIPLRPVTPDDIAIEVSAYLKGHGIAVTEIELRNAVHNLNLILPKVKKLSATLLDPNGRPLPGVTLKLSGILAASSESDKFAWYSSPESGVTAWPELEATNKDGAFYLTSCATLRKAQLTLDDPRFAVQRWIVDLADSSSPTVLRTKPPRLVQGNVVAGHKRIPIDRATVVLTSWENGEYVGALSTATDAQGYFSIRPYVGNELEIKVKSPDASYQDLHRRIPWIAETTTQKMILPLFDVDFEPVDGTSIDGRSKNQIDDEHPKVEVKTHAPSRPLNENFSGSVVAEVSLGENETSSTKTCVICIDLSSGRWQMLAENARTPRISPDGDYLLFHTLEENCDLYIGELTFPFKPRRIARKCVGPTCWLPKSDTVIANVSNPLPQDYYGQEFWALETDKQVFNLKGKLLSTIKLPPLYAAYDVSPDGKWVAMHWDTHATETGAQLFAARLDGSNLRTIARKKHEYYWYPRFSPDGTMLLAKHLDASNGKLSVRIIAIDGLSEASIELPKGFGPETACWSPDGEFVAIAAYQEEAFDGGPKVGKLFVVDAEGQRMREIGPLGGEVISVSDLDWTAKRIGK